MPIRVSFWCSACVRVLLPPNTGPAHGPSPDRSRPPPPHPARASDTIQHSIGPCLRSETVIAHSQPHLKACRVPPVRRAMFHRRRSTTPGAHSAYVADNVHQWFSAEITQNRDARVFETFTVGFLDSSSLQRQEDRISPASLSLLLQSRVCSMAIPSNTIHSTRNKGTKPERLLHPTPHACATSGPGKPTFSPQPIQSPHWHASRLLTLVPGTTSLYLFHSPCQS